MFSNNKSASVSSKSSVVPSDHQQDYTDGDTIRFDVPSFMGFIDPRQSYLKMDVQINSTEGRMTLNRKCGIHSVINNLRIYDGTNRTQLENIENYAELVAKTHHYSKNESINHKRELTEALEIGDLENGYFFDTYLPTATITTATGNNNKVQVACGLKSGILGGDKMFPVVLTQGLKVEIDLNDAKKCVQIIHSGTTGHEILNHTATAAGSATCDIAGTVDKCPFVVGQVLELVNDNVAAKTVVSLGALVSITHNAGNTTLLWTTNTGVVIPVGKAKIRIKRTDIDTYKPTLTFSNIELVLKQVSPPSAYVNDMMKQAQSEQGVNLDIYTYNLYRKNVASSETISQQNIPSYNTRALSVLSLPINNTTPSVARDSLETIIDGMIDYNFYINGQSQPSKKVDVSNLARGFYDQVALWENQKALMSCGVAVRNLLDLPSNFMVSRALGRYGGVYNLRDGGDLELRCEYSGSAVNKLFLNYICVLRRINIGGNGVQVML